MIEQVGGSGVIAQAIIDAISAFPNLTPDGIGSVLIGNRKWDHQQIETAIAFLKMVGATKQPTVGSYTLKHMVEDWGQRFRRSPYVANGAVIVAAHALGFVVKPYGRGNPNAGIGVGKRLLKKIMQPLGWSC